MSTKQTYLILLIIIVLVVLGFIFLPKLFMSSVSQTPVPTAIAQSGIDVSFPVANTAISSPTKVTGQVNGDGWTGFEGEVGTVMVLDSAGKVVGTGILTAVGEWMQLPTKFETSLQFTAPAGTSGFLVFKNENASGEPSRDKTFVLPVTFK